MCSQRIIPIFLRSSFRGSFFYGSLVACAYHRISVVFSFLVVKNCNFKNFFSIFTTRRTNYLAGQTNDLELWGILCWDLHFRKCFKENVIFLVSDCLKRFWAVIWDKFCDIYILEDLWQFSNKFCSNFTVRVMWDASCFAFKWVIPELFSHWVIIFRFRASKPIWNHALIKPRAPCVLFSLLSYSLYYYLLFFYILFYCQNCRHV